MLRDEIKFAVVTRDEKFFDVPRLDSKGGQDNSEVLISI